MSAVPFEQLGLCPPLLRALQEEGYTTPTPVQVKAIPLVLDERDLMATAQTGTGKTAAFALPILHLLQQRQEQNGRDPRRGLRALVLTPTRELALQIDESLRTYGRHLPFRTVTVLGGVSDRPQIAALRRQPDILVATPGRLLDLMGQGHVRFEHLEFLVLDEADRMLDMGFIKDVDRIIAALPARRQSLLFSATLPREIIELATSMLRNPASVSVAPAAAVADNIAQQVLYVQQDHKKDLLTEVLRGDGVSRALVFTRTKHRANRVAQQLTRLGIAADAIHSNKSQGARQRALASFDGGRTRVLVATDIMARGIDVEDISHVINYELPNEPESYVHRIGRTARAGAAGTAISFCSAEEMAYLEDIEKLTGVPLTMVDDHSYHAPAIAALRGTGAKASPGRGQGGGASQGQGSRSNSNQRRSSPRSATGSGQVGGRSGGSRNGDDRGNGNRANGNRSNGNRSNGNSLSGEPDGNRRSAAAGARRDGDEAASRRRQPATASSGALRGPSASAAAAGVAMRMAKPTRSALPEPAEPAIVTFGRSRRSANSRGR